MTEEPKLPDGLTGRRADTGAAWRREGPAESPLEYVPDDKDTADAAAAGLTYEAWVQINFDRLRQLFEDYCFYQNQAMPVWGADASENAFWEWSYDRYLLLIEALDTPPEDYQGSWAI